MNMAFFSILIASMGPSDLHLQRENNFQTPENTITTCRDFSERRDIKLYSECLTAEGKARFLMFLILSAPAVQMKADDRIDQIDAIFEKYEFIAESINQTQLAYHLNNMNSEGLFREATRNADISQIWTTFNFMLSSDPVSITVNTNQAKVIINNGKQQYQSYSLVLENGRWLIHLPSDQ